MVEGAEFDWDTGNREKCQKHGLSLTAIGGLFLSDPFVVLDVRHSQIERRMVAMGTGSNGRMMFVGFTIREIGDRQLIRPITAR